MNMEEALRWYFNKKTYCKECLDPFTRSYLSADGLCAKCVEGKRKFDELQMKAAQAFDVAKQSGTMKYRCQSCEDWYKKEELSEQQLCSACQDMQEDQARRQVNIVQVRSGYGGAVRAQYASSAAIVTGEQRFISSATASPASVYYPNAWEQGSKSNYPVLGITPDSEVLAMKQKYEAEIKLLKDRLGEGEKAVEIKPDILVSGRKFRLIDREDSNNESSDRGSAKAE